MDYANLTQEQFDERLAQTPPERHSSAEIKAERLATCNACPAKTTFLGFDQCGECKCFIIFKASFKNSKCPLQKWPDPV